MQFLSENRLNGCQLFGRFGFLKPNPNTNRILAFRTSLVTMGLAESNGSRCTLGYCLPADCREAMISSSCNARIGVDTVSPRSPPGAAT